MRTATPPDRAIEGALPIDPRIRQRRVEVERAQRRRSRKVLLGLLIVGTLVGGGFAALHSSLLGVRRVMVSGPDQAGPAVLMQAAGIRRGEPLVDVAPGRAARRLEGLPWVRTAVVRRHWPGTVRISLTERVAVAQVAATEGAPGPVALVDVTGRVLADEPAEVSGLPLLAGVGGSIPVGGWLPGSPGAPTGAGRGAAGGVAGAGASGPTLEAALVLAAALDADHLSATRVDASAGTAIAVIAGGATTVTFGTLRDLTAKLHVLQALAASGALHDAGAVDLEVADRPTVTPRGVRVGGVGAASGAAPTGTGQG